MNELNWSTNVSQYLTKRREQTQRAYLPSSQNLTTSTLKVNSSQTNNISTLFYIHQHSLFESFFYILGNKLAQGHTVLNVCSHSNNNGMPLHRKMNGITPWQVEILELVLLEWDIENLNYEDDTLQNHNQNNLINPHTDNTDTVNSNTVCTGLQQQLSYYSEALIQKNYFISPPKNYNLDIIRSILTSPFKQVIQNTDLKKPQQNQLLNQLKLAIELYHFFSKLNVYSSDDDIIHTFYENLCQIPLFVQSTELTSYYDYQNQNNNQAAPIVITLNNLNNNVNTQDNAYRLTCWIHRSWQAEYSVLANIDRLNKAKPVPLDLTNINQKTLKPEQLSAINTANSSAFSIITGGPGTGKTYTVAQFVIAIYHANVTINQSSMQTDSVQHTQSTGANISTTPLNIVLAAPTGKAAQRMQESLSSALEFAKVDMHLQEAKTIHRLLGIGESGIPRYNIDNPLSEDIIIVDEASMLGVELANYLLCAVKTGARLILLGDSHQLSAVDAGAVLFDLCQLEHLKSIHANLTQSTRFNDDSAVGKMANIINTPVESDFEANVTKAEFDAANAKKVYDNITKQVNQLVKEYDDITLYSPQVKNFETKINATQNSSENINTAQVYQKLAHNYQKYFDITLLYLEQKLIDKKTIDTLPKLMNVFNMFRILTSGHHGNYGDDAINHVMTQLHRQFLKLPAATIGTSVGNNSSSAMNWYHGRPVMVTKNNYMLGLFNGDIGLCIQTAEGLAVYFEGIEEPLKLDRLSNLEVRTSYAMTVHKSQGSEFEHVAVMLNASIDFNSSHINRFETLSNSQNQHLLSREMLYTAVTRAKKQVSLYASLPTIAFAIMNPTIRQTGLGISC